jgi:3-dehydroquinate dehydratase
MGLTEINKDRIAKTIMQDFLELFRMNIDSVTVPNAKTNMDEEVKIQRYASRYNDIMLSTESNYPILIVNKPQLSHESLSFRDTLVTGLITIEIHCTNSIATDKFYDMINSIIDSNRGILSDAGITKLLIDSDDNDTYPRGGFKDHWDSCTWSFEYDFTNGD